MPLVILEKNGSKWGKTVHMTYDSSQIDNSQLKYNVEVNVDSKYIEAFLKYFVENKNAVKDNEAYDYHCSNLTTKPSNEISSFFATAKPSDIEGEIKGIGISMDNPDTKKVINISRSDDGKPKKNLGRNLEIEIGNIVGLDPNDTSKTDRVCINFHVKYQNISLEDSIKQAKNLISNFKTDWIKNKKDLIDMNLTNFSGFGYVCSEKSKEAFNDYNSKQKSKNTKINNADFPNLIPETKKLPDIILGNYTNSSTFFPAQKKLNNLKERELNNLKKIDNNKTISNEIRKKDNKTKKGKLDFSNDDDFAQYMSQNMKKI